MLVVCFIVDFVRGIPLDFVMVQVNVQLLDSVCYCEVNFIDPFQNFCKTS